MSRLLLLLCSGVAAQHGPIQCPWSDKEAAGCAWTSNVSNAYCAQKGPNKTMDCWTLDCCSPTPYCLGCTKPDYGTALSCEECVALNGYWCDHESLCAEVPMAHDSLQYAQWFINSPLLNCPVWSSGTCPNKDYPLKAKLFDAQNWVYDLANVKPAWAAGWTGAGVQVRVNDIGVASAHPDFAGRFRKDLSCGIFEPADPSTEYHGTVCASIIASAADAECSAGIAYDAELASCKIDPGTGYEASNNTNDHYDFLSSHMDEIDVSSNSWGTSSCQKIAYTEDTTNVPCPFIRPFISILYSPCEPSYGCAWGSHFDRRNSTCRNTIARYCTTRSMLADPACDDFMDLLSKPCQFGFGTPGMKRNLRKAVTEGRGGKGVVFVFAAGNGLLGGDVEMSGAQMSRMTISVGAVNKIGLATHYSTPGAAVFISAPGGDHDSIRNFVNANSDFAQSGTCRSSGVGTSYAAPVVSGVVALVLQANPELHWRDVQGVLQASANTSGPAGGDEDWLTNAAGVKHHHRYGFGVVDAMQAVETAKSWVSWSEEKLLAAASPDLDVALPDDGVAGVTSSLEVEGDLIVESVVVHVDVSHPLPGDLVLELVSPDGTTSVLHSGRRRAGVGALAPSGEMWKLMTVAHWGEGSAGTWTLKVTDTYAGEKFACADKPYSYAPYPGFPNNTMGCPGLEMPGTNSGVQICNNGSLTNETFRATVTSGVYVQPDGTTPLTQCCSCGGGQPSEDVAHELNMWSVTVYGRSRAQDGNDPQSSSHVWVPIVIVASVLAAVGLGVVVLKKINVSLAARNGGADAPVALL